jgi:hypothetical protein
VMLPFEPDSEKAEDLLASVPVKYVIVDDLSFLDGASRRYAEPVIRYRPDRWRLVFAASSSATRIYERIDSSAS